MVKDINLLADEYSAAKAEAEEAAKAVERAKERLLEAIGESPVVETDVWTIKQSKVAGRKTFVVESFAKDHPALELEPYYRTGKDNVRITMKSKF